jgi:multidrug resistance efflux pump
VFNVDSIKMRHRMEQIEDSLNLQRARLGSELARLKWEAERVEDSQQLVKADYYEKWSELLWEESVLTDLTQQLTRAEKLNRENAITVEQFESLKCRYAGQEKRVGQLAEAVHSLQRRLETDRPIDPALNDQIKPSLVLIENLQSELSRVRQVLDQGLVTCPTNGRVTRILKYSGEYVDGTGAVIELLVDGSTEIILYLSQSASDQWSIGDQMDVRIEPANRKLDCEVVRLSPEMQRAPDSIMRHYTTDDVLFPVVLRPRDPKRAEHLVLGSKVRLPRVSLATQTRAMVSWFGHSSELSPIDMEPVREALTNRFKQQQPNSHRTASLR